MSDNTEASQPRQHRYVGPIEIKQRLKRESHCVEVGDLQNLLPWSAAFLPSGRKSGNIPATFVIDTAERLWIANRQSEHVACADRSLQCATVAHPFSHFLRKVGLSGPDRAKRTG